MTASPLAFEVDKLNNGPSSGVYDLSIKDICKTFEEVEALKSVSLDFYAGEFFTLLGPSGCGKTTLLRIIAGLEMPDAGEVFLSGRKVTSIPASKRQVNTVFQSYALFPHLTIFENVAFGLRARKFAETEVRKRVGNKLELLGLNSMAQRRPHQLSGGERQRVALARALVNEPRVLLLDEPMSALDAKLRAQVQVELRRLQRELGQTFVMVTHDQAEALVCSDRIAVMREGRVIQFGTPEQVYDDPKTRFVAEFLGAANLIQGRRAPGGLETDFGFLHLENAPPWETGTIAIRPEFIHIRQEQPSKNGILATVRESIYRGADIDLWLDPGPLRVRHSTYERYKPGSRVWIELDPAELVILID